MATANALDTVTQTELAAYVAFATSMVIKKQEVADADEAVALLRSGQGLQSAQVAAAGSASQWQKVTAYVVFGTGATVGTQQAYWIYLPQGDGAQQAGIDSSGAVWTEQEAGQQWTNVSTGQIVPTPGSGWTMVSLPAGPCYVDPVGKRVLVAVQTWLDKLTNQYSAAGPALAQNQFPNATPGAGGAYPAGLSALIPTPQDYVSARLLWASGQQLTSSVSQVLAQYASNPATLTASGILLAGGWSGSLQSQWQDIGTAQSVAEVATLCSEYVLPPPAGGATLLQAVTAAQASVLKKALLAAVGGLNSTMAPQQAQLSGARSAREVAYLMEAFGLGDPFAGPLGLTSSLQAQYSSIGSAASVPQLQSLCAEYGLQPPSAVVVALGATNVAQALGIGIPAAQSQILASGLQQAVAIATDAMTNAGILQAGDLAQAISNFQSTGSSPADMWEDLSQPLYLTNPDGSVQVDGAGQPVPNPNRLSYVPFVGEKNDYYRSLVKYNGIDPFLSRTASQFQIIQPGTSPNLTSAQQSNFMAVYTASVRVFLAAFYEPAYASQKLYLDWCRMTIAWMSIMRIMGDRLGAYGSIDDYGQWEATNQLYSYGLTGYDDMPLVYKRALLKTVENVLRDKGSFQSFFDIAGAFGIASQLTIYRYYLVKYYPNSTLVITFPVTPGPNQGYQIQVDQTLALCEVVADDPGINQASSAGTAIQILASQLAGIGGVAYANVASPNQISIGLQVNGPLTSGSFSGGTYDFTRRIYVSFAAVTEGSPDYAAPQVGFLKVPVGQSIAETSTLQLDPSFLLSFESVTSGDPTWQLTAEQAAAENFSQIQTKYVSLQFALDAAANGFLLSMLWTTLLQAQVEGRTAGLVLPGASSLPGVSTAGLFDSLVALLIMLFSQFGVDDTVPSSQEAAEAIIRARTDNSAFPSEGTLLPYSTVLARIEDYSGVLAPADVGSIATTNEGISSQVEASTAPNNRTGGGSTGATGPWDNTSSEWRTNLGTLIQIQQLYDWKFIGDLQNSVWGGATTYTEWMQSYNPGLLAWAQAQIAGGTDSVDTAILNLSSLLQDALPGFNFALAFGVDDVILAYVEKLINYFISYTSQILPLTQSLIFNQPGTNALQLMNYSSEILVQIKGPGDGGGAGTTTPVWSWTGPSGYGYGPTGTGPVGPGGPGGWGPTGQWGGPGGGGGGNGWDGSGPTGWQNGSSGYTGWQGAGPWPGVSGVGYGSSGPGGNGWEGGTGWTGTYGATGNTGTYFESQCCAPSNGTGATIRPYMFVSEFFDDVHRSSNLNFLEQMYSRDDWGIYYPAYLTAQQIYDGPTNLYVMNDASGSEAVDSVGGATGAYNAPFTLAQPELVNGVTGNFSAYLGAGGYMQVPFTELPKNGQGAYSIEFVCVIDELDYGVPGTFTMYNSHADVTGRGWRIIANGEEYGSTNPTQGYLFYANYTGGLVQFAPAFGVCPIEWGSIVHLVITCDGQSAWMYQNGYLVAEANVVGTMIPGDFGIVIGSATVIGYPNYYQAGPYSNLAFYDYCLSQSQVEAHWRSVVNGQADGTTSD